MDTRSQWKFDIAPGGWTWTVSHPDGSRGESERAWPTLKDCVDDAARHGYVAWKPEEERRRDKVLPVVDVLKH